MDNSSSSGPSLSCLQPWQSLAQSLRRETIIANIRYRIESVVNFLSATQELLEFVSSDDSIFLLYQQEIITIIQLARTTLEKSGAKVYLWVSCPSKLEAHKKAYIELLRMLEKKQELVDSHFKRSVRVLLMPLTSRFSMSAHRTPESSSTAGFPHSLTRNSVSSDNPVFSPPGRELPADCRDESLSSLMLPPNEFDETTQLSRPPSSSSSNPRRLWDLSELAYGSIPPRHRSKSRPPHHQRPDSHDADIKLEQENVAPESTTPFRQAPTRQQFGIFLTRKSSMFGNLSRKDRKPSWPTH